MKCNFQIFQDNTWKDCALLTLLNPAGGNPRTSCIFEYDLDYAFEPGAEPVSLNFPVTAEMQKLDQWPAFIFDLIPQGSGRTYLLGQLTLNDGPTADFPLMCAGAFNPIGRVRVAEAVQYYANHIVRHDTGKPMHGFSLEEIIGRGDAFNERMLIHSMLAAGSLGVQGAAPKYLLTTDHDGKWHADGALPDQQVSEHFIVKRPRGKSPSDFKVLKNEASYMKVAKALGLRTAGELHYQEDTLFIPRFDRLVKGNQVLRLHQESVASIAGIVGFETTPSQFTLLEAIRSVVDDKTTETIEFLKRDVLNLAMRNTDNHARNTAVQKNDGRVSLTPLFDFAPMYLDPAGIPRAARWYHPETNKELQHWQDILAALALQDEERNQIRLELYRFGQQLIALEQHMQEAGVDDDIIAFLKPHIAAQIQQLQSLDEDGHGAN
jgi:serine/threonine-protein kinase HipA